MGYKYKQSIKILFSILPVLFLCNSWAFTRQDSSGSAFSPEVSAEVFTEFKFGGLKSEEVYEVYYDGYYQGQVFSDAFGRVQIPLPWSTRRVEIKEYLHAESSVSNWDRYD